MKKSLFLICVLTSVCQSVFSQAFYKKVEEVEIPERFSSLTNVEYRCLDDGEGWLKHGSLKINDVIDLEMWSDFNTGKDTYTLSTNYKEGMLNGTFTMSHKENYSYIDWDYDDAPMVSVNSSSSFSAKFIEGVPDGALKLQYSIKGDYLFSYSGGSRYAQPDISKISLTCSFKKGILVGAFSLKAKEGLKGKEDVVSGTFTSAGKMTGKWSIDGETVNLLNGVYLDSESYDANLKSLAKKFGEGKLTLEQLEKDYCVRVYEEENDILEDLEEVIIAENLLIPWEDIGGYDFTSAEMPPLQTLGYLPSVTEEEMKMMVESIKGLDVVKHHPDSFFSDGDYACKYVTCTKSEGVSDHCVQIDWSDYGYNEPARIYLTDAQYKRLWNEFAARYGEYLAEVFRTNTLNSIESSTTRAFLIDLGCPDEAVSNYTPMVGYELCGAQKVSDSFVLSNKIDVENETGVGFKTFKWDVYLDAETYDIDLLKTFDVAKLVQVPNQYDTINVLLDSINVNTDSINVAAKDALVQSRNSYNEKHDAAVAVSHDDLDGTIKRMRAFLKAQEGAVQWMNRSAAVQAKNNEVMALAKDYSDVQAAFARICASVDCSWNEANDTTQLAVMTQLQERAVEFIGLRGVIKANHNEILSKVPDFSNLKSAYSSYLMSSDLTMSTDVDFAKLQAVIAVQTKTLPFIEIISGLAQTDSAIRKAAASHEDVLNAYSDYIRANHNLWTPSVDDEACTKMKGVQALTLEFVALRDEIAKNEAAIQKSGESAPAILSPYTEFVSQADLAWTSNVDLKKLQNHIAMQQKTQQMIDNNTKIVANSAKIREEGAPHADLIAVYNTYIGSDIVWTPDVDVASTEKILDVQQKTLKFVELRNKVVENDAYLKENATAGKGLYKLYTVYRKGAVLTWTSEVEMTALETLVGVQEDCKTMLAYDDIREICKSIKKAKIKDIVIAIENYKR